MATIELSEKQIQKIGYLLDAKLVQLSKFTAANGYDADDLRRTEIYRQELHEIKKDMGLPEKVQGLKYGNIDENQQIFIGGSQ